MGYTGFQLSHPEMTLDLASPSKSSNGIQSAWEMIQRLVAGIALLSLLPLLVILFAAVRLSSEGPFIFRQHRVGLNGHRFNVYKIRTMRRGTERESLLGVNNTSYHITKLGRILRTLKIDEIPQLWNIAKGEMNFVGPRPIPVPLNDKLVIEIPGFNKRYEVKPGLTSIGQICIHDNQLDEKLVSDWSLRFEGELHYIRNRSVGYDFTLMTMTVLYVARKLVDSLREKFREHEYEDAGRSILGIAISSQNYDDTSNLVVDWAKQRQNRTVGVCNVHSVATAGWDPELFAALQSNDINTADGMPLVWMLRLLGAKKASRVYGPTLMLHLLAIAKDEGLRVAFYGGHKDRLEILLWEIRKRFPGIQIAEAISPPFGNLDSLLDAEHIYRLNRANPHMIFVGLGCPKQELWMAKHKTQLSAVLIGVGAAFDFHANAVPQAPVILQKIGMEWAFRLYQEPRRLAMRYLTTNPIFLMRSSAQLMSAFLHRAFRFVSASKPGEILVQAKRG